MDYLQYIHTVNQNCLLPNRFLVSGADSFVRQTIGQNVVASAYNSGKTLFIMDNTQNGEFTSLGAYRVVDILSGEVDISSGLLEVSTLKNISRLRSLLTDLGFDNTKALKVVHYLSFIKETERRLGNSSALTIETLESYGGTALVKWKLRQLVESGKLTNESYEYLLSRYAEVSAAAADFEMVLVLLAPFMNGSCPPGRMAVHMPVGTFEMDKPMQKIMSKLVMSYIKEKPNDCAILILDAGKGDRSCIIDLLKTVPPETDVHLFSTDAFSLPEGDLSILMNTFPTRIYSRHESMSSCAKIESCCGQIEVVKRSYTTTMDKRLRGNSAFDMLLGTNRTEAEIRNAPVQEARYRKETINSMSKGTAIIDCGGIQTLFQF